MEKTDAIDRKVRFWSRYLKAISLIFAFLGAMWAIMGSFDPFGLYDRSFALAFWDQDTLPPDARTAYRFLLGPFGATSAGYFVLQYFIARHAYACRQLWGYTAIVTGFLVWLILDTGMCLVHRAYFNILWANVPSLLAMLPVFFTRKLFTAGIKNR